MYWFLIGNQWLCQNFTNTLSVFCDPELLFSNTLLWVISGESWAHQTAKLVLQQFGGSAQRSLRRQRLEGLDAVGWRVSGTHRVAAHADICTERAKYKYTRPWFWSQRPRTYDYAPAFHKNKNTPTRRMKLPHIAHIFNSPAVTLFRETRLLSTLEKFSPSSRSLASNGCGGWERTEWDRVRQSETGQIGENPQQVHFPFKANR